MNARGGTKTGTAANGMSLITLCPPKVAASSGSIIFNTSDFDWTISDLYQFDCLNFVPSADASNLITTLSIDNGLSFGDSAYFSTATGYDPAGTLRQGFVSNGANILLVPSISNTATEGGASLSIVLVRPSSTGFTRHLYWFGTYSHSAVDAPGVTVNGSGSCADNSPAVGTSPINAIKFSMSAGTILTGIVAASARRRF